ncbi:MAG: hypothetical protein MJ252_04050 [archaeon]|nr:hypothetical protein [archaeon]
MKVIIILFKSFLSAKTCKNFLDADESYKKDMKQLFDAKWFNLEEKEELLSNEEKEKFHKIIGENIKKLRDDKSGIFRLPMSVIKNNYNIQPMEQQPMNPMGQIQNEENQNEEEEEEEENYNENIQPQLFPGNLSNINLNMNLNMNINHTNNNINNFPTQNYRNSDSNIMELMNKMNHLSINNNPNLQMNQMGMDNYNPKINNTQGNINTPNNINPQFSMNNSQKFNQMEMMQNNMIYQQNYPQMNMEESLVNQRQNIPQNNLQMRPNNMMNNIQNINRMQNQMNPMMSNQMNYFKYNNQSDNPMLLQLNNQIMAQEKMKFMQQQMMFQNNNMNMNLFQIQSQNTQMPNIPQNKNDEKGKYTCRYEILIENDDNFQIVRKIIGNKGFNMKKIIDACNDGSPEANTVKLRIRGRGSGYREGPDNEESDEPLHLCVSAKSANVLAKACILSESLLNNITDEYNLYCEQNNLPHIPTLYHKNMLVNKKPSNFPNSPPNFPSAPQFDFNLNNNAMQNMQNMGNLTNYK